MPVLSLVIVNFNYGRFIESAIRSVVTQPGFEECELIVVDGGSTDDSVSIIQKYASKISWWCSEPDAGQSAAFNKGFSHACGKYLTWVNADDVLVDGAIKRILNEVKCFPGTDWFTGNFLRFNDADRSVVEIGWGPHWYPDWLQFRSSPLVIFGPSSIFSKRIYECVGRIDERMHLMMDTDLWMRFVCAGVKLRRVNAFIWAFRMHQDSKTAEYGDHRIDVARKKRFVEEDRMSRAKTGYRCSRVLRLLGLFLRVLDMSLPRKFWYQILIRRFDK